MSTRHVHIRFYAECWSYKNKAKQIPSLKFPIHSWGRLIPGQSSPCAIHTRNQRSREKGASHGAPQRAAVYWGDSKWTQMTCTVHFVLSRDTRGEYDDRITSPQTIREGFSEEVRVTRLLTTNCLEITVKLFLIFLRTVKVRKQCLPMMECCIFLI